MDGLTLLRRARDAGLAVETEGDKLVIRGPKRAEAIALLLIEHKPEVMAALAPAEFAPDSEHASAWWRRQYLVRTINWELSGARSESQAQGVAWGEIENRWHSQHGQRLPRWQCAGCHEPIGGLAALDLGDDNRVHFDGAHGLDCLLSFGERWRRAAAAGLRAVGLDPPRDCELP